MKVKTLEALRKARGWKRMNLLGQSWGTILGFIYASEYPTSVERLMLVSAVGARGGGPEPIREEFAPPNAERGA